MKRTPLRKQGKSETAKLKREIQALLRAIKIAEQQDCWVRLLKIGFPLSIMKGNDLWELRRMGECDNVFQYDHLESRARSISYANPDLGVLACRRHHFWHGSPRKEQRETYERLVRIFIGAKRAKLWDRVKADRRSYPKGAWEWGKEILALKAQLAALERAKLDKNGVNYLINRKSQ